MMKRFLIPLLLLSMAVSCQTVKNEASSAAEEYYFKYAGRKDLTVALVSGYQKDGATLNVVKLQAHNDEAFKQLLVEFDVKPLTKEERKSTVAADLDAQRTMTLTRNETNVIVNGDTLEKTPVFNSFSDFGDFVDSMMKAIVAAETGQDGNVDIKRIAVVDSSVTVRHTKVYNHDILVNESSDTTAEADFMNERRAALMKTANIYGNRGFGTLTDDENLTLWLLFYNSMEEFMNIVESVAKTTAADTGLDSVILRGR